MQTDTIVLPVDILNNGTPTNRTYTRSEELADRTTYRGPEGTLSVRDAMQFYRTLPKRAGNFLGSAKMSVKFTQDKLVDTADGAGETPAPLIAEVSFSIPVGVSDADILAFRQRVIALLDNDTVMTKLNSFLEI